MTVDQLPNPGDLIIRFVDDYVATRQKVEPGLDRKLVYTRIACALGGEEVFQGVIADRIGVGQQRFDVICRVLELDAEKKQQLADAVNALRKSMPGGKNVDSVKVPSQADRGASRA
jgi:hypothetical protein